MADGAADLPLASHVSQSSLPCDACAAGKSHCQLVARTATYRTIHALTVSHFTHATELSSSAPTVHWHGVTSARGRFRFCSPMMPPNQQQLYIEESLEQFDLELAAVAAYEIDDELAEVG